MSDVWFDPICKLNGRNGYARFTRCSVCAAVVEELDHRDHIRWHRTIDEPRQAVNR